ncbi:MAG: UDP-2,3-diacylglucosamine diphosphatase [Burkholderiaceae bacterium]|nr:UDP-2,3-diacylglucosamine diphosphatase [Burkholderiaceae bacterium]
MQKSERAGAAHGMIEIGRNPADVALFASDMHLGEHDAATAAQFLAAFNRAAGPATHVFLLGDLFEAWAGDDQPDTVASDFIECLRRLVARGTAVFVVRGNRDFLLDVPLRGTTNAPSFSQRSGATLLDDPSVLRLFGRTVLLAHGDALCTGDVEYQRARAIVRSRDWQADFLARPLDERMAIARQLRDASRSVQAARALEGGVPGDVDEAAVVAALRDADAQTLVHGHTHRPALHHHEVDGTMRERWVLSDWHAGHDDEPARGAFLRVDRDGWRTLREGDANAG